MTYTAPSRFATMTTDRIPVRDTSGGGARHRRVTTRPRWYRPLLWALGIAGVALLVLATIAVLSRFTGGVPVSPAAAPTPSVETTMGTVSRVLAPDLVQVDTRSGSAPVRILGLAPLGVTECGYDAALAHANERLVGQPVTLVPDPTVPDRDQAGQRRAYVVLRTQQNYTDDVLLNGLMAPSTEPLWYSEVFAREDADARAADAGRYGDPCNAG